LSLDDPIVTLLRCSDRFFLCIGEVCDLIHNNTHTDELDIQFLSDTSVKICFQLLYLVSSTNEDDPTGKHDWKWSRMRSTTTYSVPGRLVEPVNPDIGTTQSAGKPFYLFESSVLMTLGAMLFGRLVRDDANLIPTIADSGNFPYRTIGGMI
jgi:RecA-family ATPase